jgi:hypothetical protein
MIVIAQRLRLRLYSQRWYGRLRIALAYGAQNLFRLYALGVVSELPGTRLVAVQANSQHTGQHAQALHELPPIELWQDRVEKYQQFAGRHDLAFYSPI